MTGKVLSSCCVLVISLCIVFSHVFVQANFDFSNEALKDLSNIDNHSPRVKRGEESGLIDRKKKIWSPDFPREVLAGRRGDPKKRKDFREIKDLLKKANKYLGTDENSSESESKKLEKHEPSAGVKYLGCIAAWEDQKTDWRVADEHKRFDTSYTPELCVADCQRKQGAIMQVAALKGAHCQCSPTYLIESLWIDDDYCNIIAPVVNYVPGENGRGGGTCGGNLGYSVYCIPGENSCENISKTVKARKKTPDVHSQSDSISWGLEEKCTVCRSSDHCRRTYLGPSYDYFPANSPEACVKFCSESLNYVGSSGKVEKTRNATEFALMTYWKDGDSNLPVCRCLEENLRNLFTAVDDEFCGKTCPGEPESVCGGCEIDRGVYSTVYCVNVESGVCRPFPPWITTEDSVTSTTEQTPGPTEAHPCSTGEFDCDDPVTKPGKTTVEPTTTEVITTTDHVTPSTTTTTTTTSTEPPTPSTTPPTTTTTLNTSSFSTTSETTPTTVSTSSTPKSTPSEPPMCDTQCKKMDSYGHTWRACANTYANVPCSKLANNATGTALWYCQANGEFATSFPDVSNCVSPWVKEREEKIEEIKDLDTANDYMKKLEEDCRNAKHPDSVIKYFGQDISSISSIVDLVIKRIRAMGEETKTLSVFDKIVEIVENAVNINAILIQHRDPWEYLSKAGKSSASTNVIESTESALFNLTDEFVGQNFSKFFSLDDDDEESKGLLKFLILAEAFNKENEYRVGEDYEFPPRHSRTLQDSFIKLPPDWKKHVPEEKVEIAAMSIDPEFVSYIMPGQFELASGAELEGEDDYTNKLINGKLISFSLTSSPNVNTFANPRMTFTGKGVEIIFYHDIEAWGDARHQVHRRLHYNEKPRAVLGTTQCVFWDTNNLNWSSDGCQIVKSNRYKTVCECSHLTSFAVLMDVHTYVGKQLGLEILTLILCPLSELALFLSIVILSSVNNLQKMRTTITRNLAACLFVGNGLVLFVLDRNYFNMNEGMCIASAMLTHYVFLCAFMWMLVEGIQLYRMVVHVFDSGKSYLKHFAIFAYVSPLLVVSITATTGYLQGDKPYGGDVYCWLEGTYIWSFMAPVAIIIMINFVILFIALKTAYQVKQNKKHSQSFFQGKIRSYKTWLKGCFSLTCILGLTWVVGFFTLMRSPAGIVAAYLFTILNSSQGIFIFLFNCVFNEKVRSYTQRNLSTYLPSWLSSSLSSNNGGNDNSVSGKRPSSPGKTDASALSERSKKRLSKETSSPVGLPKSYMIPKAKLLANKEDESAELSHRTSLKTSSNNKVDFNEAINVYSIENHAERCGSIGTISSVESLPNSTTSENGHISSDTSHSGLIRSKNN